MDTEQHRRHDTDHDAHWHGESCGHEQVQHEDHLDWVHDGHRHAQHDGHYDEHGTGDARQPSDPIPVTGR